MEEEERTAEHRKYEKGETLWKRRDMWRKKRW